METMATHKGTLVLKQLNKFTKNQRPLRSPASPSFAPKPNFSQKSVVVARIGKG
jgi:hypothetical protein